MVAKVFEPLKFYCKYELVNPFKYDLDNLGNSFTLPVYSKGKEMKQTSLELNYYAPIDSSDFY